MAFVYEPIVKAQPMNDFYVLLRDEPTAPPELTIELKPSTRVSRDYSTTSERVHSEDSNGRFFAIRKYDMDEFYILYLCKHGGGRKWNARVIDREYTDKDAAIAFARTDAAWAF